MPTHDEVRAAASRLLNEVAIHEGPDSDLERDLLTVATAALELVTEVERLQEALHGVERALMQSPLVQQYTRERRASEIVRESLAAPQPAGPARREDGAP